MVSLPVIAQQAWTEDYLQEITKYQLADFEKWFLEQPGFPKGFRKKSG